MDSIDKGFWRSMSIIISISIIGYVYTLFLISKM